MLDLWNFSTSVRNPERLPEFLNVASKLEGKIWNKETQEVFQILLIQHRLYLDSDNTQSFNKLSLEQQELLRNKEQEITFEQAKDIFKSKAYVGGGDMRGRQSMNPLKKLGFIYAENNETIYITEIGKKLLNNKISFEEALLESLLKYQLPNPITKGCSDWNSKPFISTLRLIKRVNEICEERNITVKGISFSEFGIFVLSLLNFNDIETTANELLNYRKGFENIKPNSFDSYRDFKLAQDTYKNNYIQKYLGKFNKPEKNTKEYGDSMKRYLRQTKYIRFLGAYGNQYIDLEPRRMIEIDSILETDSGECKNFSKEEWLKYMGSYGSYELPFETIEKLSTILSSILDDISKLENKLSIQHKIFDIPADKKDLKEMINQARNYRTLLQNKEIKYDYSLDLSKIDTAVSMLKDISVNKKDNLINKPSVELEKWVNIALNIINDAEEIKPNTPVGDDNEPTFTAPANVPDIECYYKNFSMVCEVTMLKNRDQWYNEGQPVMRHLREFENKHTTKPNYCLFVAPALHKDTLGTYWNAVKYEYDGFPQKIVPITINQLTEILSIVKELKISGRNICKENMLDLYERCTNLKDCKGFGEWPNFIESQIKIWAKTL